MMQKLDVLQNVLESLAMRHVNQGVAQLIHCVGPQLVRKWHTQPAPQLPPQPPLPLPQRPVQLEEQHAQRQPQVELHYFVALADA